MPKQNTDVRPWDMTSEELISELYIKYGINTNGATRQQLINTLAKLNAKQDLDQDDVVNPNEMTVEELQLELSRVYNRNTDGYSHQQLIDTLKEILANQLPRFKIGSLAPSNIIKAPNMMTSQELRDELIQNFTQTVNGYNDQLLIDAVTRLRSNQHAMQPTQMEILPNVPNPLIGGKRKSKQNKQNKRHFKIWF
jgi:hypothetical protein